MKSPGESRHSGGCERLASLLRSLSSASLGQVGEAIGRPLNLNLVKLGSEEGRGGIIGQFLFCHNIDTCLSVTRCITVFLRVVWSIQYW